MDAARKAKLGKRWVCYSCEARFYDLNRPEPTCPRCQADQRESPGFEKPKRTRARKAVVTKAEPVPVPKPVKEVAEERPEAPKAAKKTAKKKKTGDEAETEGSEGGDFETLDEDVVDSDIDLDDFELVGDSNLEEDTDED
jgi:hypothetical protein